MKNNRWVFAVWMVLIIVCMASCSLDGGTIIITNNSNREYYGRVWTDSKEIYHGRIRAWNSKSFYVSGEANVHTDFETGNGGKSNPSGYISGGRTLILDL